MRQIQIRYWHMSGLRGGLCRKGDSDENQACQHSVKVASGMHDDPSLDLNKLCENVRACESTTQSHFNFILTCQQLSSWRAVDWLPSPTPGHPHSTQKGRICPPASTRAGENPEDTRNPASIARTGTPQQQPLRPAKVRQYTPRSKPLGRLRPAVATRPLRCTPWQQDAGIRWR